MKALDLFCCAGGATRGLQMARFHVTGVDIKPQPRYVGDAFVRGDAVAYAEEHAHEFDFIWASPICQKHTALAALQKREYACFIPETRDILQRSFRHWVIENVPGAPLIQPARLCGSSFGLNVRRHRIFEATFLIPALECRHHEQPAPIDVSGTGSRRRNPRADRKGGDSRKPLNIAEARTAMGIDWMSRLELSQAIPPAYAQFIGEQAMIHIRRERAA